MIGKQHDAQQVTVCRSPAVTGRISMGFDSCSRYRDTTRRLEALGMEFHRQAREPRDLAPPGHPLPHNHLNHPGDMPAGPLRAILKRASIEPEAFLQKK